MDSQGLTLLSEEQIWGYSSVVDPHDFDDDFIVKIFKSAKPEQIGENNNKCQLSEQIGGNNNESQLEVIKKYGIKAAITDLCILTGCGVFEDTRAEDSSLTGRTGIFWTSSMADTYGIGVRAVFMNGDKYEFIRHMREGAIRPVLQSSVIFSQISPNRRVRGYNGTEEVEYGEYPQNAADSRMQNILESEYNSGMHKTGSSYTFDSVKPNDHDNTGFKPVTYEEYEYQGNKYIRIKANSMYDDNIRFKLSNGVEYGNGDYVWVKVSPVRWLIDDKTGILISKKGLVSGVRFLDKETVYEGFDRTEMKEYLDKYMLRDLTQNVTFTRAQNITPEEIIRGAIESDATVFFPRPSSEDKSAKIK